MSETRFTLRRPDPDPAADVESYIDHGTSALPAAPGRSARASAGGEDPPPRRAAATQHPPQIQAAGRGATTMSDLCRAWVEEALEGRGVSEEE